MGFLDADMLYPSVKDQKNAHKRKRLVQGPKSKFLDVRCESCSQVCPSTLLCGAPVPKSKRCLSLACT